LPSALVHEGYEGTQRIEKAKLRENADLPGSELANKDVKRSAHRL